jgi:2,4-dienoyl-CoA reductase-like NADH-dependent reductase (Old Yellow Enzyme family)
MVPWRATDAGFVTQDVLDWYERFAAGRPAAIVVEATGIRDVPSGPLLRIGDERFLPGLRKLVEIVRRASDGETRLFMQLIDFLSIRRRPDPARYFAHFLPLTDRHRRAFAAAEGAAGAGSADAAANDAQIRRWLAALQRGDLENVLDHGELEALDYGARERVTDMHLAHIRKLPCQLPGLFASAAARAREAGFDGVELHYAHAYTMASFLSPLNTRDDGYGGAVAERARLALEVYRRVRADVGADFSVGCRFLAEECAEGGARSRMPNTSPEPSRRPAWIFCRYRAAENSTMRSNPRSARRPIPIPDAAVMNACLRIIPTCKVRSAATSVQPPASAPPCARRTFRRR